MGTNYVIYKEDDIEISIDEMSNKLELVICDINYVPKFSYFDGCLCTNNLEPTEMLKVFMKGIKNISYWMSKEEFQKVFSELEVYPY